MKSKGALWTAILCLAFILLMGSCGQGQGKKLRVCFDVGHIMDIQNGSSNLQSYVEAFLRCLTGAEKDSGLSPDDVAIEIIPSDRSQTTERSATLQRIRTEIMTGGGPDVFVCAADTELHLAVHDDRLFPYVEKAQESGFFLPLDEYLGEWKLSPWEEMSRQIMDGGKDRNGRQVLLPMTYTLPLLSFYQEDVPPCDFTGATWEDVLTGDDSALTEQVRWFWSIGYYMDVPRGDNHGTGMSFIYPEIIRTEEGALSFTEEELLNRVKDSLSAYRRLVQQETQTVSLNTLYSYDTRWDYLLCTEKRDLTILPLRNQQGGTTAVITTYCAVNRNTKQPDKAVAAVEVLLSEGMWLNSNLVTVYNYPVNQRVLTERNANADPNSFFTNTGLTEKSFQEFLKAVEQVNAVRIPSRLDYTMEEMIREIQETIYASRPDAADEPWNAWKADFILGDVSDEKLAEIVHKYYMKLCRLVDES